MEKPKIMVIENDQSQALTIQEILSSEGFPVDIVDNSQAASDALSRSVYGFLFVDSDLPDQTGLKIIKMANQKYPEIESILMTDHPGILIPVDSNGQQIFDYLTKPFNPERIRLIIRNAYEKYKLERENRELAEQLTRQENKFKKKVRQATLKLQNVNKKLQEQARTDFLTGLFNHRYFQERLEDEVQKSTRYKRPLSLLMIDIDQFKRINDSLGHQSGDELIHQVGQFIRKNMRNVDLVARYGGDEFAVILSQTSGTSAVVAAEKLRQSIEKEKWDFQSDFFHGQLTISIGVANMPVHANTKDELNSKADKALYQAKREGRNRVCLPPDIKPNSIP